MERGFSLHAGTFVKADDREGLARLIRYGARLPFAQEQLSLTDNGDVHYRYKKPWGPHGITHLVLPPVDFLERYAALIPPPYLNMTRYYGIIAANASRRMEVCPQRIKVGHAFKRVVKGAPPPRGPTDSTDAAQKQTEEGRSYRLKLHPCAEMPKEGSPEETKESGGDPFGALLKREGCTSPYPQRKNGRIPWAELAQFTFLQDVTLCPKCGGKMTLIAAISCVQMAVITKILLHLGLPVDTSEPLPAKLPSQMALELDGDEGPAPPEPWEDADWADDEMTAGFGRAPPE
jgi:hypothetical protein